MVYFCPDFLSSGYFYKIFHMHLQKGLVYICTKTCLLPLLHFWNYNSSPNGQTISFIGALAHLQIQLLRAEWHGGKYWRLFIVEYLQLNKLKKKSDFNPIY